jgi:glycosyltransferase involved in cell wall biosynthesis
MAKNKIVIQFICYSPRIYSGFDRFNLVMAKALNKRGYKSVFVFSDKIEVGAIIEDLLSENVIIELISTRNRGTTLRDLIKLFLKYKPAVVHAHFDNFTQLATALLSILFASRYYISFHSTISLLTIKEYKKRKGLLKFTLLKIYYRFLILTANNIICVSYAIQNQFRQFSGSQSPKIQSLYLGVNIPLLNRSKGEIRTTLALPSDEILLVNVSAIEHIKGLDILLKSVQILKNKYQLDNFRCYHIGGIRTEAYENILYRNKLVEEIKKQQLENIFISLGSRNDINEILSAFDIYVQPSRREGIPVAVMEACAHALPVVGTRIGGIPEIIDHGKNGFLFLAESAEEMADYLNLLIKENGLRARFGSESYNIFSEQFNSEKQTESLVYLYLKG